MIVAARDAGKKLSVFADETRPVLQGARLTAWELRRERIPVTVITDNMAHLETAALGVWTGVGGRDEKADEHGMSHLLEQINEADDNE